MLSKYNQNNYQSEQTLDASFWHYHVLASSHDTHWLYHCIKDILYLFVSPGVAAAGAGSGKGVSSHWEGQRPQRLQEAAQDENQCSGALHQDRLEKTVDICWIGL